MITSELEVRCANKDCMWKGKNQDAEKHDTECLQSRSHLSGYDGVQTNGFAPVREYHACLEKGK